MNLFLTVYVQDLQNCGILCRVMRMTGPVLRMSLFIKKEGK